MLQLRPNTANYIHTFFLKKEKSIWQYQNYERVNFLALEILLLGIYPTDGLVNM